MALVWVICRYGEKRVSVIGVFAFELETKETKETKLLETFYLAPRGALRASFIIQYYFSKEKFLLFLLFLSLKSLSQTTFLCFN